MSLASDECQDFWQMFRRVAKVEGERESMTLAEFLGLIYKSKKCWLVVASHLSISAGLWFGAMLHKILSSGPIEAARACDPTRVVRDTQMVDVLAMGGVGGRGRGRRRQHPGGCICEPPCNLVVVAKHGRIAASA